MIDFLKNLFISLFDLLPGSFLQPFLTDSPLSSDFLGYLNWFVPFDIALRMITAWAHCIAAYFIFILLKNGVFERILRKLFG